MIDNNIPPRDDGGKPVDADTITAATAAVDAAKARGWSQDDLKQWFAGHGVDLSDYRSAKAGNVVTDKVRGVLAMISITGLPDVPRGAPRGAPPGALVPFAHLPEPMKHARRWLLWRSEAPYVEGKKRRKVPYYASGRHRGGTTLDSPADVAELVDYDTARAAMAAGGFTGLGFALGPDGEGCWQGVDLDAIETHPGLKFIIDHGLPGYVETSPSGEGLHAIGYGRAFGSLGSNTTGIEAYAKGRYFTVTGLSAAGGALACIADFVEARLVPLHGTRAQDTSAAAERPHEAADAPGALAWPGIEADLRSALARIPNEDRSVWVKVSMALKAAGEQARPLWLEWSQAGEYDPEVIAATWNGFKPDHISYKSVFAEAQARGWVNPARGGERAENHRRTAENGGETTYDPETGEVIEAEPESEPFRASEFVGDPPDREWIIDQWIIEGAVNSLYGDGGLGKTLLAQQLACAVATGGEWLGMRAKPGAVLAVLCEDDKGELHRRHNAIKAASGHVIGNPYADVWLWPRVGDVNVLISWNRDDAPVPGDFMKRLVETVERINPALLILDTLADFYAGNEISRPHVNYFVKTVLGGLIKRQQASGHPLTVLLLGHPSVSGIASGSGYSGSTAWNNAVRSRMYLTRPAEGAADDRVLTRGKANYAKSGDETAIRLYFADGVLHAATDEAEGGGILWGAREDACKLVDAAWGGGEPYSAQKTHRRYIYKTLPGDLKAKGYTAEIIRQALRELIEDDGIIAPGKTATMRGYKTARSRG